MHFRNNVRAGGVYKGRLKKKKNKREKLIEGKWDGAVAENRVGCDRTGRVCRPESGCSGREPGRAERD